MLVSPQLRGRSSEAGAIGRGESPAQHGDGGEFLQACPSGYVVHGAEGQEEKKPSSVGSRRDLAEPQPRLSVCSRAQLRWGTPRGLETRWGRFRDRRGSSARRRARALSPEDRAGASSSPAQPSSFGMGEEPSGASLRPVPPSSPTPMGKRFVRQHLGSAAGAGEARVADGADESETAAEQAAEGQERQRRRAPPRLGALGRNARADLGVERRCSNSPPGTSRGLVGFSA